MKFYNMKKTDIRFSMYAFIIAFSLSFFLSSCNSDPSKKVKSENLQAVEERSSNDANAPEITFDFDTYDYGEVVDGEVVEVDFNFTYNFDKKIAELKDIKIDNKIIESVNKILNNVVFKKEDLQNKIYFKNLLNEAIKNYAG